MNPCLKRIFALLFALCLSLCVSVTVLAAEPEAPAPLGVSLGMSAQENIVYTQEELQEWIDENYDTGSTVFLGRKIVITDSILAPYNMQSYPPLTIDTNRFGLVFDGGDTPSDIYITGEGVDMLVVEVLSASNLFYMPSGNNILVELNIAARGRNGMGGTALKIVSFGDNQFDFDRVTSLGKISSIGKNAVGIEFTAPLKAYFFKVEVNGENSTAVLLPEGMTLYYSNLLAEGADSTIVQGDGILDSCITSPKMTIGSTNKVRSIEPSPQYAYVEQNSALCQDFIADYENSILRLSGGDGYLPVYRCLPVDWDDSYLDIDTSVLGTTIVSGNLIPSLCDLDLANEPLQLIIEVRDPSVPCIGSITSRSIDSDKYFDLNFWNSYNPEDSNVILWRSDDKGKTWYISTLADDIVWNNGSVEFHYTELKQPVQFKLEELGVGVSNIVTIAEKDTLFKGSTGSTGGDRTGTDRDEIEIEEEDTGKVTPPTLPEEEKTPDPENENIPDPESENPPAHINKPKPPNSDNYDTNSRDQSANADQTIVAIASIENDVLPRNSDIEEHTTLFIHATAQDLGYKTALDVKAVDITILPNATKDPLEKVPVTPSNTPNAVGSQKEALSPEIEQQEGTAVEKTVIVLLFVAAFLIISLAFLKLYRKRSS